VVTENSGAGYAPIQRLDEVTEIDVDTAFVSAIFGLVGVAIGRLTSFATSWMIQQAQLREKHREAERAKRESLYREFVVEASRLLGDALRHQKDDVTDLVKLYALVG
jgi:hypothetical protein